MRMAELKKTFVVLFGGIIGAISVQSVALSAPAQVSASEVAKIEAEAKKVSQEHKQMEQKANQVKQELAGVQKKMLETAKKIQASEDEVARRKTELDELQKHLAESEEKFRAENGMLIETLAALENLALRPSEAVLVQPLSPVEVMRSSILLRGSAHALESRASAIRASIEDISNQKQKIDARLAELEEQSKSLEVQRDDMEKLSKQKSQMYNSLSTKSAEAKKRATELANQASGLRDLLEKLEKQRQLEVRQREEKERLAKAKETEKLREANNHGLSGTGYDFDKYADIDDKPMLKFSEAKGKLSRPAKGAIVTAFHQELSKGVKSNGIDIKTASKAQIIAPYDGKVIFAGPFKNFDTLVIMDNGEGYTTLLSGMKETYTQVGQMLLVGEPVGIMPSGDSGKLHMEIRKNNQPLNPSEWLTR